MLTKEMAKAGGQDEKNESNRERSINNELYRRYTS